MTPAFNLQTGKGHGFPRFSATGGMPSAMLAGLSDRLSNRRFVSFFTSDISPNSLHVARQPLSTEAVGQLYHSTLKTANLGLSVRVSVISLYTVPVIVIIAEKRRRLL